MWASSRFTYLENKYSLFAHSVCNGSCIVCCAMHLTVTVSLAHLRMELFRANSRLQLAVVLCNPPVFCCVSANVPYQPWLDAAVSHINDY